MRTLTIMLLGAAAAAPVAAQTVAPATQPAPAATAAVPAGTAPVAAPANAAPAVAAGARVVDTSGAAVGTIESVANGVATLSTGTVKVAVPVTSFAASATGPVIAMTKAEIEAKASQATQAVTIAVGDVVTGPAGAKIGTVTGVTGDLVTVSSATAKAQLPKASFAKAETGLTIGLTPAQFDAAAKAAGGGTAKKG